MKAKRIVSILLTGSMLLSLLPVSALAAAPVFDAPAQTTAQKAAPLVQEADASRSTEEEAATRSSRDLDAENGTAESITIQLNAEGKPESMGNSGHWKCDDATSFNLHLHQGTFTLQPSSEAEAKSALQVDLKIFKDAEFNSGTVGGETYNEGTISDGTFQAKVTNDGAYDDAADKFIPAVIRGGTFQGPVDNWGTISNGTFLGEVYNDSTISNGDFQGKMYNSGTISGGTFQGTVRSSKNIFGGTFKEAVEVYASSCKEAKIEGGTFEKGMTLANDYTPLTIEDGLFDGEVATKRFDSRLSISGGLFTQAVDVSHVVKPTDLSITGGYFVSEPTLPEGSDTTFATVSDQAGRTFQVPVNGDWSESYTSLYVPRESSGQHNTITVKTNTKLLYYLADGKRFPVFDSDRDNYIFEIPVRNNEKIVLVTEEPPAPPTDNPGISDTDDTGSAIGAGIATGVFVSGATYLIGTNLWLNAIYDFVPTNRIQLAVALWNKADCPAPVSTELYPDIDADDTDAQAAARWCVEQGLMKDYHETDKDGNEEVTFKPYRYMFRPQAIKAWYDLETLLNEQQ